MSEERSLRVLRRLRSLGSLIKLLLLLLLIVGLALLFTWLQLTLCQCEDC